VRSSQAKQNRGEREQTHNAVAEVVAQSCDLHAEDVGVRDAQLGLLAAQDVDEEPGDRHGAIHRILRFVNG